MVVLIRRPDGLHVDLVLLTRISDNTSCSFHIQEQTIRFIRVTQLRRLVLVPSDYLNLAYSPNPCDRQTLQSISL